MQLEQIPRSIIMKFLSPLTYPQKFIFISCLFGFSILVSGYFMINAQNYSIRFVKTELKGIQYEKPLRKLMENVSKFQLSLQRYLQGKGEKSELLSLQSEINANFKTLHLLDEEFETGYIVPLGNFQLSGSNERAPEEIEHKWRDLSNQAFDMKIDQVVKNFDDLGNDIKTLMLRVGERANLVFDPEIDSSYLIQSTLINMPEAQGLIPQITAKSEMAIQDKELSSADRDTLLGLVTLLKANTTDAKEDIEKVFEFEKSIKLSNETQNKLKDPFRLYLVAVNEFVDYIDTALINAKEIPASSEELLSLNNKTLQSNFAYWDAAIDELQNLLRERLRNFIFQQRVSVLITVLSAIAGFFIGFLTMRHISRPLENLFNAARDLAAGDLSVRVPIAYKDEVGQVGVAFNQMAESFQELIGQLQWTGIQLTTSTTEIAATAKQQETTIVEQEATTKEIAATAREISTTAKDFAKTMNEVSSTAEQTSSLASSGKAGLQRMETIMHQMVDAAGNIASKLSVLNEKAGSITSIITTIAKVADQTNLLSLNAAIEAEKAGEYGRSFAVIAREIRRLADQTANATLDIEKMVNEMVSAVSAGVMGVDKFSEEINTGVNQVSLVGEQLSKIIEQVQQQTSSFESVNQGMQAQSLGAEQINESINQLSEAAQQTTESIRQFHNAIEQLNNAAQEMQNAVSKIKR